MLDIFNDAGKRLRLRDEVKLYFANHKDSSAFLRSLKQTEPVTEHRIAGSTFLLALGTPENYQRVIEHVGPESAKDLLLGLRDAAALRHFAPEDSDFITLSNQNAFQESVLRGSEAYLAYIGFGRLYQDALNAERKSPEVISFNETISVERGQLELHFYEDSFGRNRSHVFIGPNGSGKTRLLIDLAKHVLSSSLDNERNGKNTGKSPVLVLTHEPSRWVEVENLGASVRSIAIHGDSWVEATSDLYDIVRSSAAANDDFSWSAIARIVRHDMPLERLHFPSTNGPPFLWRDAKGGLSARSSAAAQYIDRDSPPIFTDENGTQVELSSGQKAVLVFLLRLFSGASQSGLVIVDEPETHLHPNYIGNLMQALNTSLQAKQALAVIATHSPYVVRHVPRSCVTVLRRQADVDGSEDSNEYTEFLYPTFQTRGGDVELISEFVFEIDSLATPLLKEQITGFLSRHNTKPFEELVPLIMDEYGTVGVRIAEAEIGRAL